MMRLEGFVPFCFSSQFLPIESHKRQRPVLAKRENWEKQQRKSEAIFQNLDTETIGGREMKKRFFQKMFAFVFALTMLGSIFCGAAVIPLDKETEAPAPFALSDV